MEEMVVQSVGLPAVIGDTAAKKSTEFAVDRVLNWVVDNLKAAKGNVRAAFKAGFSRYLQNAELRYNQVRTLTTTTAPRAIVGPDSIYVNIGVRHDKKVISTDTVENMLHVSNNILIVGTGGIGKSMLMRYLFINTVHRGTHIPVLLELRKISNQPAENISVIDLIYSCMSDFDVQLPRDEFEYSLRTGKYLFLFDGFDEVKAEMAAATAEAIQAFCSKYPKNCCIVTSRPREDSTPLQTFTTMTALPLSKEQAVLLASKVWPSDEKTVEFCRQLETELYDKHKEFASNPLLLTMMFLTFMRNNSIPDHLADFYEKAFDALYSAHDNNDKGVYHREFKCKDLDETTFKKILAHFCFHTYFKEKYEFTETEILTSMSKSIEKNGVVDVSAKDFVEDLCKVVCFMVKEGGIYRFAHRSFQAYFAAYYTEKCLTDEQQRYAFHDKLSKAHYFSKREFYTLLYQMEPERFMINVLEDGLRDFSANAVRYQDPDSLYLFATVKSVVFNGEAQELTGCIIEGRPANYEINCILMFQEIVLSERRNVRFGKHYFTVRDLLGPFFDNGVDSIRFTMGEQELVPEIQFETNTIQMLTECLKAMRGLVGIHAIVEKHLAEIYERRASLSEDDFFDSL